MLIAVYEKLKIIKSKARRTKYVHRGMWLLRTPARNAEAGF
jgi:hypothetical protein